MDLVNKKLLKQDKCICAIQCSIMDVQRRRSCIFSIVENNDDHGVFIYGIDESPVSSQKLKNLFLNQILPIDGTFQFKVVSSQTAGIQAVIVLKVDSRGKTLMFELPHDDLLKSMLSELRRTVQLWSQNTGFGLPSSFSWMEKYSSSTTHQDSRPVSADTINRHPLFTTADDLGGLFDSSSAFTKDRFSQNTNPSMTTDTTSTSNNDLSNWPFNEIIQLRAGGRCPVVTDSLSQSTSNLMPKNNSSSDLRDKLSVPEPLVSKALQRSRDKGLNTLGRDSPTNERRATEAITREERATTLMKQREADFIQLKDCTIFCGTYNVNGQFPSSSLDQWLTPDGREGLPPDIYAVGFQELDLSTNAYIFSDSAREEEWNNKVKTALHPGVAYKKVRLVRLVGMMLVVYIKESLQVSDVIHETVGTGLLGMVGNKGGVAIRFRLFDTRICFVNSHLAAHTEEYERRNQDFRDITSRLNFGTTERPITISDHDIVFWLGDLNYRISGLEDERCKQLIKDKAFAQLRNYDQLVRQQTQRNVFLDYNEGIINFTPTYKYDPGTDNFDSSEKNRTPAWCDRVLSRGSNIKQLEYRSHPEIKLSDHKPVSSVYSVGIKKINPLLERKVREEVMKTLDQKENETLPQVSLDVTEVIFKDVKYIELQRRIVEVTNTGQVAVRYEFIVKPGDLHYCKPWLNIDPCKGVILSGDKVSLNLEVYITKDSAPMLNTGAAKLDDIVVLHLEGGKDFFISVSGNYLPSCFGSSIESLVQMFGPVREIATGNLIQIEHGGVLMAGGLKRPLDIPKELFRLVDFLFHNGLDEDELFQQPGHHNEITQIRDCLDTGSPAIIPGTVHSVSESFISFLEALSEPVIPYKFYKPCLDNIEDFNACKQILSRIPISHRNVFKYICAFLRTLLDHSAKNKLDIKFLATLFGKVLLRSPPKDKEVKVAKETNKTPMEEGRMSAIFVYNFIINEYDE